MPHPHSMPRFLWSEYFLNTWAGQVAWGALDGAQQVGKTALERIGVHVEEPTILLVWQPMCKSIFRELQIVTDSHVQGLQMGCRPKMTHSNSFIGPGQCQIM